MVAGVVATICFLAAAVLFSTLAACFVNKQHRRKLKRKPGQSPLLNLSVINIVNLLICLIKDGLLIGQRSPLGQSQSIESGPEEQTN